jgi:cytochrome c553
VILAGWAFCPARFFMQFQRALEPMKFLIPLALVAATLGQTVWAGDADAGKAKSMPCATCHGLNGMSTLNEAPNLAGQPMIYLIEQMRAYRSGKRQNEIMSIIAKPLSNADIEDLAAWYNSIKVEVK